MARADHCLVVQDVHVTTESSTANEFTLVSRLATLRLIAPNAKIQRWCMLAFKALVQIASNRTGMREAFLYQLASLKDVPFRPCLLLSTDHISAPRDDV